MQGTQKKGTIDKGQVLIPPWGVSVRVPAYNTIHLQTVLFNIFINMLIIVTHLKCCYIKYMLYEESIIRVAFIQHQRCNVTNHIYSSIVLVLYLSSFMLSYFMYFILLLHYICHKSILFTQLNVFYILSD